MLISRRPNFFFNDLDLSTWVLPSEYDLNFLSWLVNVSYECFKSEFNWWGVTSCDRNKWPWCIKREPLAWWWSLHHGNFFFFWVSPFSNGLTILTTFHKSSQEKYQKLGEKKNPRVSIHAIWVAFDIPSKAGIYRPL